jgi:hypothetical protein
MKPMVTAKTTSFAKKSLFPFDPSLGSSAQQKMLPFLRFPQFESQREWNDCNKLFPQ